MLMLFINVCFCSQSLLYIQTLKPTWTQQKSLFFMIVFAVNTECSNVPFGMEDVCSNQKPHPMIGGGGVSSWSGMRETWMCKGRDETRSSALRTSINISGETWEWQRIPQSPSSLTEPEWINREEWQNQSSWLRTQEDWRLYWLNTGKRLWILMSMQHFRWEIDRW